MKAIVTFFRCLPLSLVLLITISSCVRGDEPSQSLIYLDSQPLLKKNDESSYSWVVAKTNKYSPVLKLLSASSGPSAANVLPPTFLLEDESGKDVTALLKFDSPQDNSLSIKFPSPQELPGSKFTLKIIAKSGSQTQSITVQVARQYIVVLVGGRDLHYTTRDSSITQGQRLDRPPPAKDGISTWSPPVRGTFTDDFFNGYHSVGGPAAQILVYELDATLIKDIPTAIGATRSIASPGSPQEELIAQTDMETDLDILEAGGEPGIFEPTVFGGVFPDAVILYAGEFDADYLVDDPFLAVPSPGDGANESDRQKDARLRSLDALESAVVKDVGIYLNAVALSHSPHIWAVQFPPYGPLAANADRFDSWGTVREALGDQFLSFAFNETADYNLLSATDLSPSAPGREAGILMARAFSFSDQPPHLCPEVSPYTANGNVNFDLTFKFPVSFQGPSSTVPDKGSILRSFQAYSPVQANSEGPGAPDPGGTNYRWTDQISDITNPDSSGGQNKITLVCPPGTNRFRYDGSVPLFVAVPPTPSPTPSAPANTSNPPADSPVTTPPQWTHMPVFQYTLPAANAHN